jgi:TolA-binding protein
MRLYLPGLTVLAAAAVVVALGAQAPQAPQAGSGRDEEFARRQYDSGVTFLRNKQYTEALKDFQAVVDSFPHTSVADDALLQIALYQLDTAHNLAAARGAVDRLLKEYPDTDSTPMAYVVDGRLTMAKGRTPSDVDAALASFERVPRLFPGADAVPAAGFYAGETLELARRPDAALTRFEQLEMEYPRSIWTARATLGEAEVLARLDRAADALEPLQRTRQHFPGTPEAAEALDDNTIVYRLFVRPSGQPVYRFTGRFIGEATAKFHDVTGVVVDDDGRVYLGHKQGVAVFDATGKRIKTINVQDPSAFFVDPGGTIFSARRNSLIAEGGQTVSLNTVADGKTREVDDIPSIALLSNGHRLVVDHDAKAVQTFAADGKYLGPFGSVNADRLAVDRLDDVAMIDHDSKGIVILDPDGKIVSRIPAKGTGYELDKPVDLTFDRLGNLYVLDRDKASVLVFGAKNRLLTTFTVRDKAPGAFERAAALAVDAAGRLYIFDERSQQIQVYQ